MIHSKITTRYLINFELIKRSTSILVTYKFT